MTRTPDDLIDARGKTHGDYDTTAYIIQELKRVMAEAGEPAGGPLTPVQRESLDMIAHKIGRILSGDPNHRDHWDDIAGYARLVSQRLPQDKP